MMHAMRASSAGSGPPDLSLISLDISLTSIYPNEGSSSLLIKGWTNPLYNLGTAFKMMMDTSSYGNMRAISPSWSINVQVSQKKSVETKAEVTALERNCSRVSGVLTSINIDLSNLITRRKP